MHFRRLACVLIGAWLGVSLFMAMVATQNFRSVDRLLQSPAPAAAQHINAMGQDAARAFLRYQVSEQNRWYFETWESIQIGLAVATLLVVLLAAASDRVALVTVFLMFAAVVVQKVVLTPNIVTLGRAIDFLAPDAPSAERTRFWLFHSAYSATEVAKWMLSLLLAAKFIFRSRRSGHTRREVDMVDEADDSHVNR